MTGYVDETVLERLRNDLGGDAATVRRFAWNFVNHWTARAERLEQALAGPDAVEADVVLLSIRSSSCMLGALPLEAESARMLGALSQCDLPGCRLSLATLTGIGEQTCIELAALFPA
ncbi:hypothetical protein GY21_04410 [Cryobacterium roopkundense]|uniref:HPt domain-containing protein n=1 Tax=Cryobacterium roopkundense TaxID=1001240 RepID=A0A099JMT3_9MICO|nr:hypothetical protein [Cryobacterium roopkundense]KGJ79674.1 hypothetical protein GY21_04410 [Cryobacterium roopkundense]MBB5642517.1 hypothetical protein [Cryobacterium roopkundense]